MIEELLHKLIRLALIAVVIFATGFTSALAQQAPQFSLYYMQPALLNPAWAGMEESLSITGNIRQQWVDLNGGPQTQSLLVHMPVYVINSGFVLGAQRDVTGAFETIELTAGYAYRLSPWRDFDIQAGISLSYLQSGIDGTRLRAPEGDYDENIINHNDPRLPSGKVVGSAFAVNSGLVVRNQWFDAGLALLRINQPGINYEQEDTPSFIFNGYYTLFGRGRIPLVYPFQLMPALAIRSDLIQTQTELTLNLNYLNNIEGGFTFRGYNFNTIDAVILHVGVWIRGNTQIGYAYDIPLSPLSVAHKGSHEVVLKFNFEGAAGRGIPPKIIYNPRYFN